MATRLRINARAQASAGGTATFSFDTAPPQHVYEGTLTLLPDIAQSSLGSIVLSPFVGDAPWGTFLGNQISGEIQQWHDDDAPLVVTATGLQPNHAYALWWIGTNYDRAQGDRPELKSPATPLNANITTLSEATLDFQHNDALVASELAIDLEDGGGVTWSLTDDPTNKRMKVGATVATTAAILRAHLAANTGGFASGGAGTTIPWDTIDEDTADDWSAANHNYVVSVAGLYLVTCAYAFTTTPAAGLSQPYLLQNGAIKRQGVALPFGSANIGSVILSTMTRCAVGDTLATAAWQNSGGALTMLGGEVNSSLQIIKLAA